MVKDTHNVVPFMLAVLLHVVLFGSLFVAFDFSRTPDFAVPLAIKGTLVTENAVILPPKVEEAPPPPVPDTSEQERREAEEQKRIQDARLERERLQRIQEQEAERKRQAADAEKRRQEDEAKMERKRVEVERQREQEIQRQREENERLRQEAEAAARQQELDEEANRFAAAGADAKAAYMFAIQQKIERNWVRPATAEVGIECTVSVRQLPGGEVVDVSLGRCNGDETVRRSIESAVYKASPLPAPRDPSVFDRDLTLIFKPRD